MTDLNGFSRYFLALMIVFSTGSSFVKADETDQETPCKKIIDACKASIVSKNDGNDKKGLFKDCVRPIMKGEKIAGVNITATEVDACRAKKRSMPNFK